MKKNFFPIILSIFYFFNFFNYQAKSNDNNESNPKVENFSRSAYLLGPGDVIKIKVFSDPNLSTTSSILNDGMLQIPLIGSINVSGMTISDATYTIREFLSKELINPDLLLTVERTRPLKISIVGEIARPGIYSMGMNENSQTDEGSKLSLSGLPTVIDAIQKAGGLTKQANIKEVALKRKLPGNENKYKIANLNLYSLIFDGNQINNPYLFDGDIIRIKKASKETEKLLEVANANLSTQTIRVNVIGEVYKPGILNLPSNSLLSQGVIAAGGPINSRSKISNIVLYRVERNGKVIKKKYKFDLTKNYSFKNNPSLQDNDTIIVNQNILSKTTDSIESISKPATGIVTIWSLLRLLND